jgi:glucosamine-6-phosphate deaminase
MSSQLDVDALREWCRIPVEKLENHPRAKVNLKILGTAAEVYRYAARDLADEVARNNASGHATRWILPCGPMGQYVEFAKIVNRKRISLKNLHVFHMDECLDWQARPLPLDHPMSYEGWMRREFYGPIDPELNVPEEQRHFPSVYDIDGMSRAIEAVGGIDTMYSGIGYRGHIAYNEPPYAPWHTVTLEEFRNSKTRILQLNVDTIIAVSQRRFGGCTHVVTPMAMTLGMKDLLSAKRIRLISVTGPWKWMVIRVLLFGPMTLEYPVTLVQGHPDVLVVADRATVGAPLG